jgi:dCTP deaminase
MVLADWEIAIAIARGEIIITPLIDVEAQIGASSIDLRLGTQFRVIRRLMRSHFELLEKERMRQEVREYVEVVHRTPDSPFILHPGEFALATTLEYIKLPPNLAGRLEGRSTWGRAGLQIHSTAGFVDPGFEGTLTFELHNMGKLPLPLYPGVRVSQLSFHRCNPVCAPYARKAGAKYARSTGAKESMFFEDYEYGLIWERSQRKDGNAAVESETPVDTDDGAGTGR